MDVHEIIVASKILYSSGVIVWKRRNELDTNIYLSLVGRKGIGSRQPGGRKPVATARQIKRSLRRNDA